METRIFVVENDLGEVFLVKASSEEEALKKYLASVQEDDIRAAYESHMQSVRQYNETITCIELTVALQPLSEPTYEEFKQEFLESVWVEGELNLSRDVTPISESGIEQYL